MADEKTIFSSEDAGFMRVAREAEALLREKYPDYKALLGIASNALAIIFYMGFDSVLLEVATAKARASGGRRRASNEAARFAPALKQYKAEPRLQKMSFERAAMELINKHGHNVSHSALKRKLSAAKKSMPSA